MVKKKRFHAWHDIYPRPGHIRVMDLEDEFCKWLEQHPTAEVVTIREHKEHAGVEWIVIYREEPLLTDS